MASTPQARPRTRRNTTPPSRVEVYRMDGMTPESPHHQQSALHPCAESRGAPLRLKRSSDNFQQEQDKYDRENKAQSASAVVAPSRPSAVAAVSKSKYQ